MAHDDIPIPGDRTSYEDNPEVQIVHLSDHPLSMVIRYHSRATRQDEKPVFGEITFSDVLEYRWVDAENEYFLFPDEDDYKHGLIEILNSKYVENMAAKGSQRDRPGKRFGPLVEESSVHHFRLAFPHYGCFDVIARGVSVREIVE